MRKRQVQEKIGGRRRKVVEVREMEYEKNWGLKEEKGPEPEQKNKEMSRSRRRRSS